jgi:peptide chain release factor 1
MIPEEILVERCRQIIKEFEDIERQMFSQEIASDPKKMAELSRRRKALMQVVDVAKEYLELIKRRDEAESLLESDDDELKALAEEELEEVKDRLEALSEKLPAVLVPPDPDDSRDVIMEIRAGVGGEEAALFAADLFRMYSRYAERKGWKVDVLSAHPTSLGGYKEIVFEVKGDGAYSSLKYEGGVHRVQRVPVTESGGRIHTSAASVVVMKEPDDVEVESREEDIEMETFRSGGKGGQHQNKRESGVRLIHKPTGITVVVTTERSQHQNRARAMRILKARLYQLKEAERQKQMSSLRRALVGSGDRSEKIRTYNFPQSRVTDHRIGLTLYNLENILDGDLDELIKALKLAETKDRLSQIGAQS